MIYLAHVNHDADEGLYSTHDPKELLGWIRTLFGAKAAIHDQGFCQEIEKIYARDPYRGFSIFALDPKSANTLEISLRALVKATSCEHQRLKFIGTLAHRLTGRST